MQSTQENIAPFVKVWATFFAMVVLGATIFVILTVGTGTILDILLFNWLAGDHELKKDLMMVPAWFWVITVVYISANGRWRGCNVLKEIQRVSKYDDLAAVVGILFALALTVLISYFGRNLGLDSATGSVMSMAGPIAVFGCAWTRLCVALSAR